MAELDEFLDDFLIESREGLDQFETDLVTLEQVGGEAAEGEAARDGMFRTLHTIKGSAGFLELPNMRQLAHAGEDLLATLRSGETDITPPIADALLALGDALRDGLATIEQTRGDLPARPEELITRLRGLASGDAPPASEPAASAGIDLDATFAGAAADPGGSLAIDLDGTANFTADDDGTDLGDAIPAAAGGAANDAADDTDLSIDLGAGEEMSVELSTDRPAVSPSQPTVAIDGLAATASSGRPPFAASDATVADAVPADGGTRPSGPTVRDEPPVPQVADTTANPAEVKTDPPAGDAATPAKLRDDASESVAAPKSAAPSTIRVDVDLLDRLMNLVGELVLTRNQLSQLVEDQAASQRDRSAMQADRYGSGEHRFGSVAQRLNQITTQLQDGIMRTRMQPIGGLFQKLPRVVRDAARETGKQATLVAHGGETELDKSLLEALADPLLHLVRNAVGHGIEPSAERTRAGKEPSGTVTLSARQEAGQVVIEIADDGRGLDADRIRAKAVEKQIYTALEMSQMAESAVLESIFRPGFSTAEAVTSVSGRGVGMDVVKTEIERIGGSVVLRSRPGEGTTVRIVVPLTLAIIAALIVSEGGQRFAIPQTYVSEVLELFGPSAPGNIESYHDAFVYRLRDELIPLVRLQDVLFPDAADPRDLRGRNEAGAALRVVILRVGDVRMAMLVEHVMNVQEIVVKPLSAVLESIRIYAGATILGDGGLALILDALGLARHLRLLGREMPRHETTLADAVGPADFSNSLVVCRVGQDRQIAIPVELVTRVVIVDRDLLERDHRREVIRYRGSILPILHAIDFLPAEPDPSPALRVAICRMVDRSGRLRKFGLIVAKALEIEPRPDETESNGDAAANADAGQRHAVDGDDSADEAAMVSLVNAEPLGRDPVAAGIGSGDAVSSQDGSLSGGRSDGIGGIFDTSVVILGKVTPVIDPARLLDALDAAGDAVPALTSS